MAKTSFKKVANMKGVGTILLEVGTILSKNKQKRKKMKWLPKP